MWTRLVVVSVSLVLWTTSSVPAAEAVAIPCPDTAAFEQCLLRFDDNNDRMLQPDELGNAHDNIGWIMSHVLPDSESLMERCDIDKNKALSPSEIMSDLCMQTCEEQRMYYNSVCS